MTLDAFGIVPEGFLLPTLRDILTDVETDEFAEVSPELDVSPASPDGQRNAIYSRQDALVWEFLATIYEMLDPDKAEDALLISLCKLSGTTPSPGTYTAVKVLVTAPAGTVFTPDVQLASILGKPDVQFTPATPITLTSDNNGGDPLTFRSLVLGPVPCLSGTLTVIAAGTDGWSDVTNPNDALQGDPADTEAKLRLRRLSELAAAGSASIPGLTADLEKAQNLAGDKLCSFVRVYENTGDRTDTDGRPGKSIEVLLVPSLTNVSGEIAQAIWKYAGGGPTKFGTDSESFTDETGATRIVSFSVAQENNVYLKYNVTTGDQYPGDASFQQTVVSFMNALMIPGRGSVAWDIERAAASIAGINNLAAFQGFASGPTTDTIVNTNPRARLVYDTTRVQVLHV